jgi:hypothetical protein
VRSKVPLGPEYRKDKTDDFTYGRIERPRMRKCNFWPGTVRMCHVNEMALAVF